MNSWCIMALHLHGLPLALLLLLHDEASPLAEPKGLPDPEGDHREVVAVADLDHEPVRVVEEQLVHVDAPLLDSPLDMVYSHLPQLLLH